MFKRFNDRQQAGVQLANELSEFSARADTLVLALPRGGVPVAHEVAMMLNLPLDLWLVRKLGVPGHEELAMGAIAQGDIRIINQDVVDQLGIPQQALEQEIIQQQAELKRRNQLYRGDNPAPEIEAMTIIVVDDGLATGATMKAAVCALRKAKAAEIIVAVPVGAISTCNEIEKLADKVVCLSTPEPFYGVGRWYRDFSQTSDKQVQELMSGFTSQGSKEV